MAYIHARQPWKRQPAGQVGVDWNHPLAKYLISATLFRSTAQIFRKTGTEMISSNGVASGVGARGIGLKFVAASSNEVVLSGSSGAYFADQAACTFVVATRPASASSVITMLSTNSAGFGGAQFRFNSGGLSFVDGGTSEIMLVGGAIVAGEDCNVGVTYDSTTAVGFKNGTRIGSGTDPRTLLHLSSVIGQRGSGSEFYDGLMYGILALSGARPAAEVAELTVNPWQIYKPLMRRIYVNTAGGGTQSFSYTASGGLTFGGAAAELRAAARAAAGGLTFAGASAEARVAARLAAGGIVFGGAAPMSSHESTRTVQAAGGLQFGGAATVSYVGGVVTSTDAIYGSGSVLNKMQNPTARVVRTSQQ